MRHIVSVSGGKDSTATLLLALERFGRLKVVPIFCDTGNEHTAVYQYLDYLETALGVHIHRLKADLSGGIAAKRMFIARDQRPRPKRWTNKAKRQALAALHPTGNPFLDLCLLKGRFPSRRAQFCTEVLKRNPAMEFQAEMVDAGHTVVSWQGVRRDESEARRNAPKLERLAPNWWTYRPIVDWSAQDVFAFCAMQGIKPNPLYQQGMRRVGCMPCINVRKDELREIAARFPNEIDRIDEWEMLVSQASKQQKSTFFAAGKDSVNYIANVRQVVEWSATARGGRQFDLLAMADDPNECASAYGLCDQGGG